MSDDGVAIIAQVAKQSSILAVPESDIGAPGTEARIEAIRRACKSALAALAIRGDREAVIAYRSVPSDATLKTLDRLRRLEKAR